MILAGFCLRSAQAQVVTVGTSTAFSTSQEVTPFANFFDDARHQYLIRASEIIAAGGNAGFIDSVAVDISIAIAQQSPNFTVRIKTTTDTVFNSSTFDNTGFTTVFADTVLPVAGWFNFAFNTPFSWDGQSNLILEMCYDNTSFTGNSGVFFSTLSYDCNRYAYVDGGVGCNLVTFGKTDRRPNFRFGLTPEDATGIQADIPICPGDSVTLIGLGLTGTGDWYTDACDSTFVGTGDSIKVAPLVNTTYYLKHVVGGIPSQNCVAFTVTVNKPQAVANVLTDNNCVGDSSGLAQASVVGGIAPFSYSWSNGDTTIQADSLAAGSYTLTITDSLGCSDTVGFSIVDINPLPTPNLGPDTLVCDGLMLSPGIYSAYKWQDNSTAPIFQVMQAGVHHVTVTDANGCENSDTIVVTFFPSILLSGTSNGAACGLPNGQVTVSASGGGGGFSYLWSTGSTIDTASGLSAGQYTVTVTDANGCTADTTIPVFNLGAHTISLSKVDVLCDGDSNGQATATPVGGTAPYTYQWASNAGGATVPSVSGLPMGNYFVTITDANSCVAFDSITIGFQHALPSIFLGNDTIICSVDSLTLNAGGGFTTYLWSDNSVGSVLIANDSGTYGVTVTDANTCSNSDSITIGLFASPVVDIGPDTNICPGGSFSVDAGGGFMNYLWDDGSVGLTLPVNSAGIYSVTVTDFNQCKGMDSIVVGINVLPMVSAGNDTVVCTGDSATFHATPGLVTYLWSDGSVGSSFTALQSGTYTVVATDTNQCQNLDSVTLSFFPVLDPGIVDTLDTICEPFTYLLQSGSGFTAYQWNTGAAAQNISVTIPGTYTITVTDANGCQSVDSIKLVSDPCVGIASLENVSDFRIYPNPTRGQVTVSYTLQAQELSQIRVLDLTGRTLRQENYPGTLGEVRLELDLRTFPAGIYLIDLVFGSSRKVEKLILE